MLGEMGRFLWSYNHKYESEDLFCPIDKWKIDLQGSKG